MMFGVFTIRVPRDGWMPEGWSGHNKASTPHLHPQRRRPPTPGALHSFWLLWVILFTNVTAGIGILEQAAPMIQDLFKSSIGATAAVGFVGLLSIFNMAGRFFWASVSDFIGRKATYFCFFTLGAVLYFFLPLTREDHLNSVSLFVLIAVVLLSMYGGGFATIPTYLKDLFGGYTFPPYTDASSQPGPTAGIVGRSSLTASSTTTSKTRCLDKTPTAHPPHHVRSARHRLHKQPARPPVDEKYWLKDQNLPESVGAATLRIQEHIMPDTEKKSSPILIAAGLGDRHHPTALGAQLHRTERPQTLHRARSHNRPGEIIAAAL